MGLIDAHCHLDAAFGGGWIDRSPHALLEVMDAAGVDLLVDLSGGWGLDVLHRHLDVIKAAAPDRFALFGGIAWHRWADLGPAFPEHAARSLRDQLRRGATGLKVWKTLGLEAVDHRGQLVAIDDERLDPIWQVCVDQGIPVTIHVGDPPEFFAPTGPDNPRSAELERHPEWHWHRLVPVGHRDLLDQFAGLLDRWPSVPFVGAHALDLFHDVDRLRGLLDAHPNLVIDLAARHPEARRSRAFGALVVDRPRRILYGLDHPPSADHYQRTIHETVATVHDAHRAAGRRANTDEALDRILRGNAAAIIRA